MVDYSHHHNHLLPAYLNLHSHKVIVNLPKILLSENVPILDLVEITGPNQGFHWRKRRLGIRSAVSSLITTGAPTFRKDSFFHSQPM